MAHIYAEIVLNITMPACITKGVCGADEAYQAPTESQPRVSRDSISRDSISRDSISRDSISRDSISRDSIRWPSGGLIAQLLCTPHRCLRVAVVVCSSGRVCTPPQLGLPGRPRVSLDSIPPRFRRDFPRFRRDFPPRFPRGVSQRTLRRGLPQQPHAHPKGCQSADWAVPPMGPCR